MNKKLKAYFLMVSNNDEAFAEEMLSSMIARIKKETPKTGKHLAHFYGSDVYYAAKKTGTDLALAKYFLEGDLDYFEMEVTVTNGEIERVIYVDGFRKTPTEII